MTTSRQSQNLKNRKAELEETIRNLLIEFQHDTGLNISDIVLVSMKSGDDSEILQVLIQANL